MNKKLVKIISLLTAVLMIFTLCACDASVDEEEETKYYSTIPTTKEEILDKFNAVIQNACDSRPAIEYSIGQGAGDAECENSNLKSAFNTVADWVTSEDFAQSTKYGEDATTILPANGVNEIVPLAITDIRSANVTNNEADETYTIIINLNGEENPEQAESIYGKLYRISTDDSIIKNFDVVKDYMTVESYDATYGVGTIKATIQKTTDESKSGEVEHITKLELSREVQIETAVTGVGTLAEIGSDIPLTFKYSSTENFSFDWDNPETDAVES